MDDIWIVRHCSLALVMKMVVVMLAGAWIGFLAFSFSQGLPDELTPWGGRSARVLKPMVLPGWGERGYVALVVVTTALLGGFFMYMVMRDVREGLRKNIHPAVAQWRRLLAVAQRKAARWRRAAKSLFAVRG